MFIKAPAKEKLAVLALSVAVLVVLLISFIFVLPQVREAKIFRDGAVNGFEINGNYRSDNGQGSETVAFLTDDGSKGQWQILDTSSSGHVEGTFKKANDPNIFILYDSSGKKYGTAHLAFALPDGSDGFIFIESDSSTIGFKKFTHDPGFQTF